MATLKEVLEQKMMDEKHLRRVCVKEACLDEKEKRHLKIKTKKIETGEMFDTHECIITLKSDDDLVPVVAVKNIIKLLRLIEEPLGYMNETVYPHIAKVIDQERVLSENKKQMDITFLIINNIER